MTELTGGKKDRTDTPLNGKWDEYLKVIGTYLDDFKTKVETAADNTGGAIQGFTNDKHISTYFATYCKDKYTAGQDYVKAQLAKQDGAEEPADGAGTGQCLPLGSKQPIFIHLWFFHVSFDGH